ncbi:zinc ribbon domain-containing protein [Anaerosalibacter massiliensis]|uniref:C4-type zinc ribbon domain-containing protein n=1 Tax=Anaerosalibacter massiliensis TaxID=1347392 RepID=A0A9X2MPT7_9FIRM|nr:C4-type zinc ribbon domain-containing protein [Anaerosalibacter massiliensis]MCR2044931.1 C4-type zinc ribbon domain-containing protein [Anaerosalibacter massiliensis]
MEQLELLWELQKHEDYLKIIKKKLEDLAKTSYIETMTIRIETLEQGLNDKEKSLERNSELFRKNNLALKDLNYQLSKIEKELYSGVVTDLKQLDYMDKESEVIRDDINKLEIDMLSIMEDMDEIRQEIEKIKIEHDKNKERFKESILEYEKITNELREEARKEMDFIYDISSKIEKDIYEKYSSIKENKGYAIAVIKEDECSGCHVIIPIFLLDKVKAKEEIVQCENCRRILYYSTNP